MRKSTVLGAFLSSAILFSGTANAACSVPNTLVEGTTASATEVMANFNALVTCFNNVVGVNGAATQSTPANPANTGNLTGVMMGLAGAITPTKTGRVLVVISGDIQGPVAPNSGVARIRYGTGAAPANGVGLTGTVSGAANTSSFTTDSVAPFSLQGVVTGLTLATPYWLDLSLGVAGGGVAALFNVTVTAIEF